MTVWLGPADIDTYKKSRQSLTEVKTQGWSDEHKGHLNAMIRECDYVIEWLQTGRRPGNKRGVERLAAYQREIPFELMERYAATPPKLVIQTEIGETNDYLHMEYILSLLSERERECYEMHIGGMYSFREIAKHYEINVKTAHEAVTRAQVKIKRLKAMPMPLQLLLDVVV